MRPFFFANTQQPKYVVALLGCEGKPLDADSVLYNCKKIRHAGEAPRLSFRHAVNVQVWGQAPEPLIAVERARKVQSRQHGQVTLAGISPKAAAHVVNQVEVIRISTQVRKYGRGVLALTTLVLVKATYRVSCG